MGLIRNFYRIFLLFLVVVILLHSFSINSFALSNGSVTIFPASNTVNLDDEFSVTVTFSLDERMYGIGCDITYDSSILQYVSGTAVGGAGNLRLVESPSGEKTVSYSIRFKAISSGICNIKTVSAAAEIFGSNGAKTVALSNSSAVVTVEQKKEWTYDREIKTLILNGEVIPDYTDDYINTPWYEYKNEISTVIINDGVTKIGNNAFCKMVALETVVLPESVTEIGTGAFSDCKLLKSINIPSKVLEIKYKTFYNCNNLKQINLENVISIGDYAFYRCNGITNFNLNNAVYIGNYSFYKCELLSEVVFSNKLAAIGEFAFSECKRLLKAVLPQNIVFCDDTAFAGSEKTNKLMGDLNEDGNINSEDIIIIRHTLLGNIGNEVLSDVNNDCQVDIRDLIYLKKLLVKI